MTEAPIELLTGVKAPVLWAEGKREEVLAYVGQDVRTTLDVALEVRGPWHPPLVRPQRQAEVDGLARGVAYGVGSSWIALAEYVVDGRAVDAGGVYGVDGVSVGDGAVWCGSFPRGKLGYARFPQLRPGCLPAKGGTGNPRMVSPATCTWYNGSCGCRGKPAAGFQPLRPDA